MEAGPFLLARYSLDWKVKQFYDVINLYLHCLCVGVGHKWSQAILYIFDPINLVCCCHKIIDPLPKTVTSLMNDPFMGFFFEVIHKWCHHVICAIILRPLPSKSVTSFLDDPSNVKKCINYVKFKINICLDNDINTIKTIIKGKTLKRILN